MIKKLTLITILLLGNIAFSQKPKLVDKYLFATLKGKIDDRYDITMNIKISISYSWTGEISGYVSGNYHYDRFGKNIYFTKGTINKNSMIIEAEGDEVFTFKLDEATLKKILELKNSYKKITINGTLEKGLKEFSCIINSVSPLGRKLSEIYKYNISGEATYYSYDRFNNWKSTFSYDGDALYSPLINVSYFTIINEYLIYTNIEKLNIDALKNTMKESFKEGISNDGRIGGYFTNDFRIGYFDNKILCLEEYVEEWSGGVANRLHNYAIISLETRKKLGNDFYEDLVNYSEEFKEFWKKEFIKYHKISKYDYSDIDYGLPKPKQSDDDYYSPAFFIFNDDGTIDIYRDYYSGFVGVPKIEMKKLKPYIKKDSFYKYLFN